jgi:hypothetical protein
MPPLLRPRRIEGYAIISEDGMIADPAGVFPASLKNDADRVFFERGIDGADVLVHGRNSGEERQGSELRRRLIVTRRIPTVAVEAGNGNVVFWNPAGASLEQALSVLGAPGASIGVLGGTDVFDLFLNSCDVFYLSRVPDARLPGGRPIFSEVPARSPEEVLARHGLHRGERQVLDPARGLAVVSWQRSPEPG